jgi:hypothetical protein
MDNDTLRRNDCHPWCLFPHRDAAVRAAEDNRTAPLPTLAEAIASPFTEAAERSSTVSEAGDGQSGMRTERVTLEFAFDCRSNFRPSEWVASLRPGALCPGLSVRVVKEPHFDDLAQVTMERDAAIRERESLREQLESVACRAATAENRVAELEARTSRDGEDLCAAAAASCGGGEPVAWGWATPDGKLIYVSVFEPKRDTATVVPLYRQPPQPRGWLTKEERACLEKMRDELKRLLLARSLKTVIGQDTERDFIAIESILARSSPPEVVLPRVYCHGASGEPLVDIEDVRAALAAAGVAVKEVPHG